MNNRLKVNLVLNSSTKKAGSGLICLLVLAVGGCQQQEKPPAAIECFNEGLKLRQKGRIEPARELLLKAIELEPNGLAGKQASMMLALQFPKNKISQDAEQRNAIGFNQLGHGDLESAEKTFSELNRDFPDFEWPYVNLAKVYIRQNKPDAARPLIKKALQINPNYLNGWEALGKLEHSQGNEEAARECGATLRKLRSGEFTAGPAETNI